MLKFIRRVHYIARNVRRAIKVGGALFVATLVMVAGPQLLQDPASVFQDAPGEPGCAWEYPRTCAGRELYRRVYFTTATGDQQQLAAVSAAVVAPYLDSKETAQALALALDEMGSLTPDEYACTRRRLLDYVRVSTEQHQNAAALEQLVKGSKPALARAAQAGSMAAVQVFIQTLKLESHDMFAAAVDQAFHHQAAVFETNLATCVRS